MRSQSSCSRVSFWFFSALTVSLLVGVTLRTGGKLQIVTDISASHAHVGILGEAESITEFEQVFGLAWASPLLSLGTLDFPGEEDFLAHGCPLDPSYQYRV